MPKSADSSLIPTRPLKQLTSMWPELQGDSWVQKYSSFTRSSSRSYLKFIFCAAAVSHSPTPLQLELTRISWMYLKNQLFLAEIFFSFRHMLSIEDLETHRGWRGVGCDVMQVGENLICGKIRYHDDVLEEAGIKDPHHTQQDEKDRESCEQVLKFRHL